ncbi:LPXTG cell wall anchor domain-containing protein [Bacillus sp. Bva_UNVM-123]
MPQTGEEANAALPLAGLTFILIGIWMIFKRRKAIS